MAKLVGSLVEGIALAVFLTGIAMMALTTGGGA